MSAKTFATLPVPRPRSLSLSPAVCIISAQLRIIYSCTLYDTRTCVCPCTCRQRTVPARENTEYDFSLVRNGRNFARAKTGHAEFPGSRRVRNAVRLQTWRTRRIANVTGAVHSGTQSCTRYLPGLEIGENPPAAGTTRMPRRCLTRPPSCEQ